MILTPKSRPARTQAVIVAGVGHAHDDAVGGSRLRHHFHFQVAAIHRLEISDDRVVGEVLA